MGRERLLHNPVGCLRLARGHHHQVIQVSKHTRLAVKPVQLLPNGLQGGRKAQSEEERR